MAYLAQSGANGLDLLGETLEDLFEVEAGTMVSVVAMEKSKTATVDDVKGVKYNWLALVSLAQWRKVLVS